MTRRLALMSASAALPILLGYAAAQEPGGAIQPDDDERPRSAIDAVTDVITVNATKSANPENVQDVPIAMTAFGQESLDALNVRDIEDLSFTMPNVALDDIGTSRGTANFAIRGLGVNSSIPSIDPAVGVFVDGVYLGLNTGVVFDVFDLDSVEVLRGPQGLLFGRNTTGGAVLLNTRNPTDELTYRVRAAVETPVDAGRGTTNNYLMGTMSGPLIPGKLNGKVAGYLNEDGGYFENQFNGEDFGKATTYIARAALEFLPTDDLTILGKIEYFDSDGQGPAAQNRGVFERDTFDFAIDGEGDYKLENWFGTVQADLNVGFGDGVITNIFGYRDSEGSTLGDIDSTPNDLFTSTTRLDQEQISNELRYNGTFDAAEVTTGFFYFNQEVAYDETRDLLNDTPAPPPEFFGGGAQDHTVYGVFGQLDYAVTDYLTLTGGLRWSLEKKDARVTYIQPRSPCSIVEGTCPQEGFNPFTPGVPNGYQDEDEWENLTPKLSVTYDGGGGALAYAQWTKGFRSGGYNFRITDVPSFVNNVVPIQGDEDLGDRGLGGAPLEGAFAFDEEEVDSYEIGAKFQTDDRRRTVNVALFQTDVQDMQREVNLSSPEVGVVQNITNTADATIRGAEVDVQLVLTDSLLLTANVGLIDAEYTDVRFDLTGDFEVDSQDEDLAIPRVPEATYGAGLLHELDIGSGGAVVSRINYQYRDEIAYTDDNLGYIQEADMLMANVTWETPYDGLSLSVYGQNLLDEVQAGNDTQVPFGGPLSTGVAEPFAFFPQVGTLAPLKKGRLVGVEVTLER